MSKRRPGFGTKPERRPWIRITFPTVTLRGFLGLGFITGFMASLFLLFWRAIPTENEQIIVYMIGQLSGFVGGVVTYHYGLNQQNVEATVNTGKMAEAIKETARAATPPGEGDVLRSGDKVELQGDKG